MQAPPGSSSPNNTGTIGSRGGGLDSQKHLAYGLIPIPRDRSLATMDKGVVRATRRESLKMQYSEGEDSKSRQARIAEAAYFRAERRGFRGGDPVTDWIDAEHEVDEELRRSEHRRFIEELEARLATAGTKLKSFKKKVATLTADARKEVERDAQRLAKLRDAFELRLEEIRSQGLDAGHAAKQQAEKIWNEISETIKRMPRASRKPRS